MSFHINFGSLDFWRLGLCQTSCMEPFYVFFKKFLNVLVKQASIYFNFLGECCNSALL